jgi:hypothetical protein
VTGAKYFPEFSGGNENHTQYQSLKYDILAFFGIRLGRIITKTQNLQSTKFIFSIFRVLPAPLNLFSLFNRGLFVLS